LDDSDPKPSPVSAKIVYKAALVYCQPAQGFFSVVDPGTRQTLCSSIDLKTKKIESVDSIPQSCRPRFSSSYAYHKPDKLPLPETKTASYQLVEPDCLIKIVAPSTELFDREYWCERRTYPIAVLDMFSRFLRQYNLVGMKEEQAFDLFGPASWVEPVGYAGELGSITYAFSGGGCEGFPFGVKLYLKDSRVDSWTLFSGRKESNRITSNGAIETVQPILGSFKFPGVQYQMIPDNE
jgi:hypothetical protein